MAIKFLSLIDFFGSGMVGGSGKVFWETNRVLSEMGHITHAICRWSGDTDEEKYSQVKFHSYKDIETTNLIRKLTYCGKSIRRIFDETMRTIRPDILIIHSSSATFGLGSLLKKLDIPIIYYFHSPWHLEYEILAGQNGRSILHPKYLPVKILSFLRKYHEASCLAHADGIITLSSFMQKKLLSHHISIKGKKMSIIPGGANQSEFFPIENTVAKKQLRQRLNLSSEDFILLATRRLVPRTGVDVLLKAFVIAKKKLLISCKLVITGKGGIAKQLKEYSEKRSISQDVIFTGYVSEKVLAEYYRCSDLSIMPTKSLEGFGLSTVEAMHSALPVIGTDVGATPEILSFISEDLIIRGCTPEAIAKKIVQFADKSKIESLKDKVLHCATKHFTWEKHVKKLLDFCELSQQDKADEGI
ncbi:MAG: glycosyltransferase family 4 protein [Verrucomicrobiota bacterium]|nr:glycosyltransferase family 4 protein [Verrucomicrobiota bacterium]